LKQALWNVWPFRVTDSAGYADCDQWGGRRRFFEKGKSSWARKTEGWKAHDVAWKRKCPWALQTRGNSMESHIAPTPSPTLAHVPHFGVSPTLILFVAGPLGAPSSVMPAMPLFTSGFADALTTSPLAAWQMSPARDACPDIYVSE